MVVVCVRGHCGRVNTWSEKSCTWWHCKGYHCKGWLGILSLAVGVFLFLVVVVREWVWICGVMFGFVLGMPSGDA